MQCWPLAASTLPLLCQRSGHQLRDAAPRDAGNTPVDSFVAVEFPGCNRNPCLSSDSSSFPDRKKHHRRFLSPPHDSSAPWLCLFKVRCHGVLAAPVAFSLAPSIPASPPDFLDLSKLGLHPPASRVSVIQRHRTSAPAKINPQTWPTLAQPPSPSRIERVELEPGSASASTPASASHAAEESFSSSTHRQGGGVLPWLTWWRTGYDNNNQHDAEKGFAGHEGVRQRRRDRHRGAPRALEELGEEENESVYSYSSEFGGVGGYFQRRRRAVAEAYRQPGSLGRLAQPDEAMKFSHSIQFNAVPDWSENYIAYSNLKKL